MHNIMLETILEWKSLLLLNVLQAMRAMRSLIEVWNKTSVSHVGDGSLKRNYMHSTNTADSSDATPFHQMLYIACTR